MSKRVRTLLRVSSKQQLHDDDIPMQRAEAKQYIAKQPGWNFDREYLEKAVSAYKNSASDRETLQEILEDAKRGEFDILLTYMSDRIGRQEEYSFYVATLNQLGIEVWTIKDGQLKTEEHVDKLLNYIRFWQNEGESKKTSMRVRDARKDMVQSGKFAGGKAPFGYRLIPSGEVSNHGRLLKKLEIVEEDAEIVRRIYHLAVYQGMGYFKIAKILNEEGVPAITTDKWKTSTIANILKNPVYMGYYAVNKRVNHGNYTRMDRTDWIYSREQISEIVIVSQQLWETAQEIREARKNKINASKEATVKQYKEQCHVPFSTKGRLALIGFVYCGYCGKSLKNGSYCNHWKVKTTGEKKVSFTGRYICSEKCKERSCYSQTYLEDAVFAVAEAYLEHAKSVDVAEMLQEVKKQEISGMEKKLQTIEKEMKRIKEDIGTLEEKLPEAIRGEYCFEPEKLSTLIRSKEQRLCQLEQKERNVKRKVQMTAAVGSDLEKFITKIPNWGEEFRNADTATKRMLLSSLIDRIEVKDDDIKIKFKIRLEDFVVLETIDSEVPK